MDAQTLCQPSCSAESVENVIQTSPTITDIIDNQSHIQEVVNNNNSEIQDIEDTIQDIEQIIKNIEDENADQDDQISKLGDEIVTLKSRTHQQEQIIKGMQSKVITDPIYNNFQEWVENVYIPQAYHIKNKYMEGDLYINVCESNSATNATYVCIRKPTDKGEYSANDRQLVYKSSIANMLTIIGIDPIEVTHPYKHEWVININPERLADMIANLRSLDLRNVELALNNVYFQPVIKDSVYIQENLHVDGKITTQHIHVGTKAIINELKVKEACIDEMTCDTKWDGEVELRGDLNIQNNLKVEMDIEAPHLHVDSHVYLPSGEFIYIGDKTLIEWVRDYVREYGCITQECVGA